MKLKHITDVEGFMKAVDKCSGDVYLTTAEGDRLNLKSQLTKIIALSTIFSSSIIEELNLEFSDPADVGIMLNYAM